MPSRMTSSRRLGRKGIAQTKIAFKGENSPNSEIYIADFDGHNAQPVTQDNSLVAAPCWVPGHMALYYVSYKLNHADIFYHNLSTGSAAGVRAVRRLEYEPGGLAGRQQSGDDPEQGRLDRFVCLRRRRQRPQAADQVAAGRVLALLVAGRAMDLLRGQGQRAPDAVQDLPLGRARMQTHPDRRHAQPHRAGLVAGRQVDRVHVAVPVGVPDLRGAGRRRHGHRAGRRRRPVLGAEFPDAGLSAGGGRGVTRSPCLTCRRNNTKMFPGFRELAHSHNPVGLNSPSMKDD